MKDRELKKDQLLTVLLYFSKKLGIQIEKIEAFRAIEQGIKERIPLTSSHLENWLEFLGEYFGIQFFVNNGPVEVGLSSSSDKNPSVAVLFFEHHTEYISVIPSFLNFLQMTILNESDKSFRTTISKFKNRVKQAGYENEIILWISAEPIHSFSTGLSPQSHYTYLERIKGILNLEISDIWVIGIYSAAIVILSLVIPIGTQSLVNILAFGTLYQPVLILTILVLVALGFAGVMKILQLNVAEYLQQRLFVRLSLEVSEKIPKSSYATHEGKKPEGLVNYFLEITTIQKAVTTLLVDGLGIFLQMVIGLLVLVLYHPFFIIFNAVIIFIIFYIIVRLLGKEAVDTSIKESKAKHELTFWFEELANHRHTFKSDNAFHYSQLRMEGLTENYINYRRKHFNILIKQIAVFIGIQVVGSGLLLGFGGWLVIKGEMSLGQLIAAEIIVAKILDSRGKAGKYFESYYDMCASFDKVGYLLDMPQEKRGLESVSQLESPVELNIQNLSVGDKKKIINIPELGIKAGEVLAIKSPSRKEASVFLNLLYGLQESDSGIIEIDGNYSFHEISLSAWRKQTSLVRGYKVFSGSIQDNISLGDARVSSGEVRDALKVVNLWEDVLKLPDGINSKLSATGHPFNRDQCFQINFARAIVGNPRLILIDEAMDFLSHEFAKEFIEYVVKNKTSTILIYTRKEDIFQLCDRIVEI
ncbi:MAG: ATP-binding cassette domain-containing protein [Leptospiraceae bacterium]|nr:ATP-binding cassette domain-containing protein [Leptospiraceae bacterium]